MRAKLALLVILLASIAAALSTGIFVMNDTQQDNAQGGEVKKTLVMGVSMDYPPFEFSSFGKPQGYDIDLAYMLAEELQFNLEIKDMDFSSLIPALNAQKIDFIISSMSPSPKRAKSVDFSRPYYVANASFVAAKSSDIDDIANLEGKRIGVQTASTMESYLNEKKKSIPSLYVLSISRVPALIEELKSGRIDAILLDADVAKRVAAKNPWLRSADVSDFAGSSVVVLPLNSHLTSKFNSAIETMERDGRLKMLEQKWLTK